MGGIWQRDDSGFSSEYGRPRLRGFVMRRHVRQVLSSEPGYLSALVPSLTRAVFLGILLGCSLVLGGALASVLLHPHP